MTTSTLTLAGFLLFRITEDEARASDLARRYPDFANDGGWEGNSDDVTVALGIRRALDECLAKRQLIGLAESAQVNGGVGWAYEILARLAAVYADHPDYDEGWRL